MPTKDRQRQLARAKLERQMARRAAQAKRRRQTQAAVGAGIAVLLVVVGGVFLVMNLRDDDSKKDTTAQAATGPQCDYQKSDASAGGQVKDVGLPPTTNIAETGTRTVTMTTSIGEIDFTLDQAAAPCTSNSVAYLIGKKFYDKTSCHRMTTEGIFVLQCGDPFADGTGGPSYRYGTENLPTNQHPPYPAGTIAMAKSSEEISVGSQFFIVYKDIPEEALQADYTVVGKVTKGLDLVVKAAEKGVTPSNASNPADGKPKQAVDITTMTVTPAAA